MKNALLRALKMVEFKPEISDLFLELIERPEAVKAAGDIYKTLFYGDPDEAYKVQRLEEDSEKCLIFTMAYLLRIDWLKDHFNAMGLSDEHLQNVISALKDVFERSHRKYGFYGLLKPYRAFLITYLTPTRFTVGRLMFEMGVFSEGYSVYKADGEYIPVLKENDVVPANGECVLKDGDKVLHVHIGSRGKLLQEEVQKSFVLAKDFFEKHFPDFTYRAFVCSSWLLDENLKNILKKDSNILKFQDNFQIACAAENKFSLYWHVFCIEDFPPPEELSPKNDFQRAILEHIKAGNKLYSGKGFIMKE